MGGYEGADCAVIVGSSKTHNCPHNCSKHGVCQLGKYFCDPGFGGHDCSVTAKCTADCYGHGICKFGKCFCDPGFAGEDCGTAAKCPNQCSDKGLCIYGKCFCQPDYEGDDCSKAPSCPTGGVDEKHSSGHGICYQGTCYCDSKFAGENCAIDTTVKVEVGGDKASNPFNGLSSSDAHNLQKMVSVKQNVNGTANNTQV